MDCPASTGLFNPLPFDQEHPGKNYLQSQVSYHPPRALQSFLALLLLALSLVLTWNNGPGSQSVCWTSLWVTSLVQHPPATCCYWDKGWSLRDSCGFFPLISGHHIALLSISQQKSRTECLTKLKMQIHVVQWKSIRCYPTNTVFSAFEMWHKACAYLYNFFILVLLYKKKVLILCVLKWFIGLDSC